MLRPSIHTLFLCLLLLFVNGCTSRNNGKEFTLRVGFFPNITHVQALLGKENIFQSAVGCPIQWKQFTAGSTEMEALMAGELDMGYIGPAPAINGFVKTNGDIQIIAGACDGGAVLVARGDIALSGIQDLHGKKVAIPQFGNTQHIVLKQLLYLNGMKETSQGGSVEIVQAANPDVKTLFDRKSIDAALIPEPWASGLINNENARVVLDYDKVWRNGNYPSAVLIARTEFIHDHPDILAKFLAAHAELTAWTNLNKEKAKSIVNLEIKKLTGKNLSNNVLDASFARLIFNDRVDTAAIMEMADVMKNLGIIKSVRDVRNIFSLHFRQ